MDKTGVSYWDNTWLTNNQIPRSVDPRNGGLNNYVNRQFHHLFVRNISSNENDKKELLEIGCARSAWLPYFAKEFGFQVCGLDYSRIGCRLAEEILKREGIEGKIVCQDFFHPPTDMLQRFDVVVSFGLLEHFEDTTVCLEALNRYVKPGGILVTVIPNLLGIIGWMQKLLSREIYEKHVLLTKQMMRDAYESVGLYVSECRYFIPGNFGIVNLGEKASDYQWLIRVLWWLSKLCWLFYSAIPISYGRFIASYCYCIGCKIKPDNK